MRGKRQAAGALALHAGEVAEGEAMTEAEWLECTDPQSMLNLLQERASERKFRLFSCACVRRTWRQLREQRSRNATEVIERYADSQVTLEELDQARKSAWAVTDEFERASDQLEGTPDWPDQVEYAAADAVANASCGDSDRASYRTRVAWVTYRVAELARYAVSAAGQTSDSPAAEEAERLVHANLLRDIFGYPFRTVVFNPAWRTPTVTALATAAYEERHLPAGTLDPDRLAVLADALEDAGCDNADMLSHLRGPGTHVRGCWGVDLLLGKE